MILSRSPTPPLRPFVSVVWATDASPSRTCGPARELVLPSGAMHVALRLGDNPLRLFAGPDDADGHVVGTCVLNGVRTGPVCKGLAEPAPSVGAMLRPGVADIVSNAPAGVLRGRYWRLDDLWPARDLALLRERLEATPCLARRLRIFERVLAGRLAALRPADPLVAHTLKRLNSGMAVRGVVEDSGFSHRHVVRVFTEAVGVAPKTYLRLERFNRTVDALHGVPDAPLAQVAASMEYSDQAHMTREFRAFAGLTPGCYRRAGGGSPRHVALAI